MEPATQPEETSIIDMIFQLKNPLTNINLCMELVEAHQTIQEAVNYYAMMKVNAVKMEQAIRTIVDSIHNPGLSVYLQADLSEIDE